MPAHSRICGACDYFLHHGYYRQNLGCICISYNLSFFRGIVHFQRYCIGNLGNYQTYQETKRQLSKLQIDKGVCLHEKITYYFFGYSCNSALAVYQSIELAGISGTK